MTVDARDEEARTAALRRLEDAHEHFAELEQRFVFEGRSAEAAGARQYVKWIRRAIDVESTNPPVAHKA